MKHWLHIFLFLALCLAVRGQQITVQAPSSVYEGDNFTVRFVVDAKASNFKGPTFKGFSMMGGPHTSSSSSFSITNGKTTSSVSTSFSYTLNADAVGTFTVGAATCTVEGKQLSSAPFNITVQKLSASQRQQRQQQQQQQSQAYDPWGRRQATQTEITPKSLFARASVSNPHPYQGEQIIVTYKIYTQVPLSQYGIDKLPGNRGFWAEDLSDGSKIKQSEETVDGERYQVAEIRRGALFAQQSGALTIEPLELNVLAMLQQQRRRTGTILDLFDDPFFSSAQAVEKALATNKINVNVKPLPSAPDGFTGGVGRFEIDGGLSLKQVKANEAVSYRVTISGSGNLMLVSAPTPDFPTSFEVYDPQTHDNLHRTEAGISGSRTFEWVLIPRSQGTYTIPALKVVYFDPHSGHYITKTINAQTIEVERGDARAAVHTSGKDDVQVLAEDIHYIHPVGTLRPIKQTDKAGIVFWSLMLAIVVATVATLILVRRQGKAMQDEEQVRRRRAVKLARRRLRSAEKLLQAGDEKAFYEEIYRAIWGCLADKYNIALAQLSRDTVKQCLDEKQVPAPQQEEVMQVLHDVDMARFAPGDAHSQMQRIYDEALKMIVGLE